MIAVAPSEGAGTVESAPPKDPTGVRAAERMTEAMGGGSEGLEAIPTKLSDPTRYGVDRR